MTTSIGSAQNVALQPTGTRPVDEGQDATARALDQQQLEGRDAVHEAPPSDATSAHADDHDADDRGRHVNKYA